MKKVVLVMLAALTGLLMLTACEEKHVTVSIPREEILEAIEKAQPTPEPEPIEEPEEPEAEPEEVEPAEDVSQQEKFLLDAFISAEGRKTVEAEALLEEMEPLNPRQAARWTELLDTWQYVNRELVMNWRAVPNDLPDDDSLCIVVLGYRLNASGQMERELTGRLETAQKCIDAYPHAWVLVTGGPTAPKVPENTEADLMAKWLMDHGTDAEQILIENKAMTTTENAVYSGALLRQHPEITHVMVVTSDYHMQRGMMALSAEMILGGGEARVVSNFARMVGSKAEGFMAQAEDVRTVANAHW
ncbi:MAG: YdcF family protein [Oscillospiraceae bacterium]|nr:YdcF family protein [Oscillospiraceae bacterium]